MFERVSLRSGHNRCARRRHTGRDIRGILTVTEEEVETLDKIVEQIDKLATFIAASDPKAHEAAASTQETTSSMDEIATSTEQITRITNDYTRPFEYFKWSNE